MSTVRIRYSKDGGNTWSQWFERPLGEEDDFLPRVVVRRMGHARHWVLDISITDPVSADLLAGSVQAEQRN